MDVHQQVDQAVGALHSVPGRPSLVAHLCCIRLFTRGNQDVCCDDLECGKLWYFFSSFFCFLRGVGVGCLSVNQPLSSYWLGVGFSYDMPASQRFDHNSSLVQMPLSTIDPCVQDASCLSLFCVFVFVFVFLFYPAPPIWGLFPLIRLMLYPSHPIPST